MEVCSLKAVCLKHLCCAASFSLHADVAVKRIFSNPSLGLDGGRKLKMEEQEKIAQAFHKGKGKKCQSISDPVVLLKFAIGHLMSRLNHFQKYCNFSWFTER